MYELILALISPLYILFGFGVRAILKQAGNGMWSAPPIIIVWPIFLVMCAIIPAMTEEIRN